MHKLISVRFAFIVERFRFNRVINASGTGDLSREIRYGRACTSFDPPSSLTSFFSRQSFGDYRKHHKDAFGKKVGFGHT